MNLDELKETSRFKNCATDDDFCVKSDCWEQRLAKSRPLDAEVTRLKGELEGVQDQGGCG